MIDIDFYNEHGYCVIESAVPEDIFKLAWDAIDPWVESIILTWIRDGLITHGYGAEDRWTRLSCAWIAAGRPHFRRQPYKNLINLSMYKIMKDKFVLDIAEKLLGTSELSVHGVFNARPQLSSKDPVHLTPIHQDSQYWHKEPNEPDLEGKTHVLTFWIPLRDVDIESGCLSVISNKETKGIYYDPYDYDYHRTGMLGLSPKDLRLLNKTPIHMKKSDILIFNQRTPHGANFYNNKPLRWALDFRYEASIGATFVGQKYGFVAQSKTNPLKEDSFENWQEKRKLYLNFSTKVV